MTLGSHQRTVGKSQVHLTPRWIIDAFGPFDLDPCAATVRPWDCAAVNYTEISDGLSLPWHGRVWLNPPFDRRQVARWIERLAKHGNGIALLHARTETDWFEPIWRQARLILFLADRLTFCKPDGSPCTVLNKKTGKQQPANSGAPAVLVAFGQECADRLAESGIRGAYVDGWTFQNNDSPDDRSDEIPDSDGIDFATGIYEPGVEYPDWSGSMARRALNSPVHKGANTK